MSFSGVRLLVSNLYFSISMVYIYTKKCAYITFVLYLYKLISKFKFFNQFYLQLMTTQSVSTSSSNTLFIRKSANHVHPPMRRVNRCRRSLPFKMSNNYHVNFNASNAFNLTGVAILTRLQRTLRSSFLLMQRNFRSVMIVHRTKCRCRGARTLHSSLCVMRPLGSTHIEIGAGVSSVVAARNFNDIPYKAFKILPQFLYFLKNEKNISSFKCQILRIFYQEILLNSYSFLNVLLIK